MRTVRESADFGYSAVSRITEFMLVVSVEIRKLSGFSEQKRGPRPVLFVAAVRGRAQASVSKSPVWMA